MSKSFIRACKALSTALCLGAAATGAPAHPMGNFSINHYARIAPDSKGIGVTYVIDMAEIPTVSESPEIQKAGGRDRYLTAEGVKLAQGLTLSVDGAPQTLTVKGSELGFKPGAGGLQTMRMAFDLRADTALNGGAKHTITYRDENFAQRTGWKEIVLDDKQGFAAAGAGFSTTDITQGLTHYPNLITTTPPQDLAADVSLSSSGAAVAAQTAPLATPTPGIQAATPQDAFTQTISTKTLTPGIMLLGFLIAFTFGAFHALSPGHGKAMVAAYLVGARGTKKHAVILGLIVTITHTLGVFALGLITLFASQYIVPEKLYPILSAISGFAVLGVGLWLLYTRYMGLRSGHEHSHDHHHDHDESEHLHQHEDGTWHTHDHSHDHDHGHHHHHDHGHDHGHSHGFGHHHHHHVPEGPITLRSLLALGISGGIVPCPSALVVLLSAVALHRIAYGMVLITAFSLGLASVLIGIGILVVSAAHIFERVPRSAVAARALPVFSAAAITCIGVVLVVRALGQGVV